MRVAGIITRGLGFVGAQVPVDFSAESMADFIVDAELGGHVVQGVAGGFARGHLREAQFSVFVVVAGGPIG